MAAYTILNTIDQSRPGHAIRTVYIQAPVADKAEAVTLMQQAAPAMIRDYDVTRVYLFLSANDVPFHGYIARMTLTPGSPVEVLFDNDPALRQAIYEAFNGESGS